MQEPVLDDAESALTAPTVMITDAKRCAARAAREAVDQRDDEEEHELFGVDQADGGVDRGGGR